MRKNATDNLAKVTLEASAQRPRQLRKKATDNWAKVTLEASTQRPRLAKRGPIPK